MTQDYKKYFKNKVVMITGGTGLFGYAVTEKLMGYEPKEVVIFSRDEKKQFDMANKFADSRIRLILGDVRDKDRVNYVVKSILLSLKAVQDELKNFKK